MATPVEERQQPSFTAPTAHHPSQQSLTPSNPALHYVDTGPPRTSDVTANTVIHNPHSGQERSSDEEGTVLEEGGPETSSHMYDATQHQNSASRGQRLTVQSVNSRTTYNPGDPLSSLRSPTQNRDEANRLSDDLRMLQVERQVSNINAERDDARDSTIHRSRTRRSDPVDDFDAATNPLHERAALYRPPTHPQNAVAKFFKTVRQSHFLVRYFMWITPVALVLLIPLLVGGFKFRSASVGGVQLMWFMIWLEIVWLTLWAGRILAKMLPWPIGIITSIFTNNPKKWRDMGKQLELPATIFFWWLAIEISFLPTMTNHHIDGNNGVRHWENVMNKVLVSLFVGAILNLVEKVIIQLIAISFHLREYEDRIVLSKFQISSLTKLYQYSKGKLSMEDSEFEQAPSGLASGLRTPRQALEQGFEQGQRVVKKNLEKNLARLGNVAGKVAADFTGKQITTSTHPRQVVLTLLGSTTGSQVLARRLYRTFVRHPCDAITSDDLRPAFDNDEEGDAAFSIFDKDSNGDISMEELESVCVELGRERKSITASLKDLDSVVGKLDDVFMFIAAVITIFVFISLISSSASASLTATGGSLLALSWLFGDTATELLQCIIFVFVKHPFDVGDRVTIYGNTGSSGKGDDYFVKEIALLYTEFKKMEGHIVQAPNLELNKLFILNQRRSPPLAEAVPIIIKFGTTLEQIDGLYTHLLEFVSSEDQRREYQPKILTELREITEAYSITLNVVFFYKSNWQNELIRLKRRNKFICAMMIAFGELKIEGPLMRLPGQKLEIPLYTYSTQPFITGGDAPYNAPPRGPNGYLGGSVSEYRDVSHNYRDPPFVGPAQPPDTLNPLVPDSGTPVDRHLSTSRSGGSAGMDRMDGAAGTRARGQSLSEVGRRVDLSLGAQEAAFGGDMAGDVYADRDSEGSSNRYRIPAYLQRPSVTRPRRTSADRERGSASQDIGRSTSIESGTLGRVMTDSMDSRMRNPGSVHRNRFFGRGTQRSVDEEKGVSLKHWGSSNVTGPLASRRQETQHLARIPEAPGGSGTQSVNPAENGVPMNEKVEHDDTEPRPNPATASDAEKIDPRTGLVSAQAWRSDTNESIPPEPGPGPLSGLVPGQQARQETEGGSFDMKRLA